jgi:hypothetical protein
MAGPEAFCPAIMENGRRKRLPLWADRGDKGKEKWREY